MWIAIFTFFLFAGYFVYGTTLEKNWKIDIFRDSSDWQEDESIISHFGFRYLQIAQFAVFLSFEALISAVYGYAYGLGYVMWLILGSVFFGGALSYYGGMYALRHRGYTLNYAIKQKFGKVAHFFSTILLLGLIVVLLSDSYKSFSLVYEGIFSLPPKLLLLYCAVVALFFSFCTARQMALILAGVGIFAIATLAILLFGSRLQLNMVEYGAHNFVINDLKYAYPFAFFVVTLGSVSCLQGLQASILAPMIKNEKVGRRVFFGSAVFQGFFLMLFNVLVAAWNPNINEFYVSLFDNHTPYVFLQNLAFGASGKQATLLIFALAIALFFGFVGVMTRLARNLFLETKLGQIKYSAGILTLVFVILPAFGLKHFNLKFEYVLIFTQLVGLLSCFVLAFVLKNDGKKYYHLIWPAVLVFGALVSYIMLVIFKSSLLIGNMVGISLFILPIALKLIGKNKDAIKQNWLHLKEIYAEKKKLNAEKSAQRKLQKQQEKELKKQEAENKKQQAELEKREKSELKKQEKEKKRQASLALMLAQDETKGRANHEVELEKEILKLQKERDKIDERVKEIEKELEKAQSLRLLSETSESVINEIEKEEPQETPKAETFAQKADVLFDEIEKLDDALADTQKINLDNLMDDEPKENELPEKNDAKFDFDDDFKGDFEFEADKVKSSENEPTKEASEQTSLPNKKKRNRKRHKKNKENQAS